MQIFRIKNQTALILLIQMFKKIKAFLIKFQIM